MSVSGVCACHRYRPDVLDRYQPVRMTATHPVRRACAIWIVANSSPAWIRSFGLCPCRLAGTPEPKPAPARDGALAIMAGLGPQSCEGGNCGREAWVMAPAWLTVVAWVYLSV